MRTPGATPNRTPKGFRALFSLWEGGGRKDSPQKGRSDTSQGNETQPLPDPSPLKNSTSSSIPPTETKTPVMPGAGADAAASPVVLLSAHCEQAENSTWDSTWQSSEREVTAGRGSMDVDLHDQVNGNTEDHTLKSMAEQEVKLRASFPPQGDPVSVGKPAESMPNMEASTPNLLKENSKTPSSFGVTPPTLRPSTAQPCADLTSQALPGSLAAKSPALSPAKIQNASSIKSPAKSPAKLQNTSSIKSPAKSPGQLPNNPSIKSPSRSPAQSRLPTFTSKRATPSPSKAAEYAAGVTAGPSSVMDDAMLSNPRTSGSFGTCRSLSPEVADEGTTCSVHAGCTPAGPLCTHSPAPASIPSDPQPICDPRRRMQDAPEATEPTYIPLDSAHNNVAIDAAMVDAPVSGAPASFPPPTDAGNCAVTTSKKCGSGILQAPPSTRPELSSPILDELERSGGSAALARAGSSLSNTLSRISSGAAGSDAPVEPADAKPVSRHRHQRSGALDFDAFLLSADEEHQRDQENKSADLQDAPDAIFVTATDEDIRCSGDTIVVHSPSMREMPSNGPEHTLMLNKCTTFDTTEAAPQQAAPSEAAHGVVDSDALNVSCASYPLNVSNSSFMSAQGALEAVGDEAAAVSPPDSTVAGSPASLCPVADPAAPKAEASVADAPMMDDAVMKSPISAVASGPERVSPPDAAAMCAPKFQFDTAMEGTTPIAFGTACTAGSTPPGAVHASGDANDVDMTGSSPAARSAGIATCAGAQLAPAASFGGLSFGQDGSVQPTSDVSPGVSPALHIESPAARASAGPAEILEQAHPASVQSRETTPPAQDAPSDGICETTPKQADSTAKDVDTPNSTPVAVALARCRAELQSGQAALGSVSADEDALENDAALQAASSSVGRSPQSKFQLSSTPCSDQGRAQHPASGPSVGLAAAAIGSSPLKNAQGGILAPETSPAPPGSQAGQQSLPGSARALMHDRDEYQRQQWEFKADAGLVCDAGPPDEDLTVNVELDKVTYDEAAKVTPPNLGSQGSQSLSIPPVNDGDDFSNMQSPTGCIEPENHASSILRSPEPTFSPAQPAQASARGPTHSGQANDKPALIIEAEEDVTAQLHQRPLVCSFDGSDTVTDDGSALNTSSVWRSVAGVNDSMDSAVARSATDSIFGIASDICCAAVGGALRSSYGANPGPRSPLPSGVHTRTGSVLTQRTQATTFSSVDTENLLASTDLSAPPSLPAAPTGTADGEMDGGEPAQVGSAMATQGGDASKLEDEALAVGQDHVAPSVLVHAVKGDDSLCPAPKDMNLPAHKAALPPAPQKDVTPENMMKPALAHQPSRCNSGGGGSGTFRVTDSCADRVWRMLRGNMEDDQAEAEQEEAYNRRDSLTVPDMPTMDVSEFEALETEALKHSVKSSAILPQTLSAQMDTTVAVPSVKTHGKTPAAAPTPVTLQPDSPTGAPDASIRTGDTPTGDTPKLQMSTSPSLDGPTVCASPRVPASAGHIVKSADRHSDQCRPAGLDVTVAEPGLEADTAAAGAKARAIKHALVNQSLTGAALSPSNECEQLLTDSVDLGEGGHLPGLQSTLAVPSGSMACLPEASGLPSPEEVPVQKSEWNVLESREWRSAADDDRPVTAPQFGAGAGRGFSQRSPREMDIEAADMPPLTSTFDGDGKRPTTPSRCRKSNASAGKRSPCSQPLRAATAGPSTFAKASSPRSPTSSKRSLSRRTFANITPNHNPNFQPHSPGKTPEAVPVNPSPSSKRSRRCSKAVPSPVSTGALLRASSDADRADVPCRIPDEHCGEALEYGDSPADIDMHATSPSFISGNKHSVPECSPLTGSHAQASAGATLNRSSPRTAHTARINRMSVQSVRGSASLMRVPEGSEMDGERGRPAGQAEGSDIDADRTSLRKSLLNIDPMRVSYGTDGLINLAGEDDCVLFQTDIQAITAALDEYPNRPATAPTPSGARPCSLTAMADPVGTRSPNPVNLQSRRSRRSNDGGAVTATERLGKSPAAFGVSPLRASRVAAAKAAAVGDGYTTMMTGEGGAEECADVGELQLRLAVALRQAEHWRREMDSHTETSHNTSQELEDLREQNRTLRNQTQKLQDRVERQQNVIDAEAFLEDGDRDHTTSLLGDDFANNLRAQEDFAAQKQQLQDEVTRWKEKYATVTNNLLPRAQSEASLAKEDSVAARSQAHAAREEASATKQKMEQMRLQSEQRERQLQREVHTLQTELNKQQMRVREEVAARQGLQERVQALQKEANEKDGLYHAKCKELSVAKLRGGPSGIGGGIGAGKLKQQLETMTAERNSLLERLRTLEHRSGR